MVSLAATRPRVAGRKKPNSNSTRRFASSRRQCKVPLRSVKGSAVSTSNRTPVRHAPTMVVAVNRVRNVSCVEVDRSAVLALVLMAPRVRIGRPNICGGRLSAIVSQKTA